MNKGKRIAVGFVVGAVGALAGYIIEKKFVQARREELFTSIVTNINRETKKNIEKLNKEFSHAGLTEWVKKNA